MKHLIWSEEIDMKDWLDFCEEEGLNPDSSEAYERVCDLNYEYFDDELMNCNVDTNGILLIFANDGLWNGRRRGLLDWKGTNIKDAFIQLRNRAADFNGRLELAVEDGELVATIWHHDGTNSYIVREANTAFSDEDLEDCTPKQLWDMTAPAGKYPAKVYGWTN